MSTFLMYNFGPGAPARCGCLYHQFIQACLSQCAVTFQGQVFCIVRMTSQVLYQGRGLPPPHHLQITNWKVHKAVKSQMHSQCYTYSLQKLHNLCKVDSIWRTGAIQNLQSWLLGPHSEIFGNLITVQSLKHCVRDLPIPAASSNTF